ncbi:tetratricopeptide repeat protein [Rubritalea tangerina]|uniref:tetratricopeptide repeat protein n=1 Tax=Rubritalea tangerina TaxID=430798 RepID=UPI00361BA4DB
MPLSQPSLAPSTPETAPTIASPEVKKLVDDAHHAHSKGDMVAALIKLEEASALAPDEPAVFYRMALLFEDMGQWERATDNYEKLFVMGPSIGVYYDKAAFKLSNGINAENPKQDLFVIGHIMRRISDDGLNARLTIPIRSTPGAEFDPTQINVVVHHYDLVDKQRIEPIPPSRANNKTERWLHAPSIGPTMKKSLKQATHSPHSVKQKPTSLVSANTSAMSQNSTTRTS